MGRGVRGFPGACDARALNCVSAVGAQKGREARFWRDLSLMRRGIDPAGEASCHNHEAATALTKLTRQDLERYEAEKAAAAAAAAKTDGEAEEAEPDVAIPRTRMLKVGEAQLPKVGEAVMVQIVRFADTGVDVSLPDYDNCQGFICYSEFSPYRMRSAASLIRVSNKEPAIVVRVDVGSGSVDLSNRLVTDEVARACEEKYHQNKFVYSTLVHVALTTATDLDMLYRLVSWPLRRRFGDAFKGFMLIAADPNIIDELIYQEGAGPDGQQVSEALPALTPEVKNALVHDIKRRLSARLFKISSKVEIKSFQANGALHIKEALMRAEAVGPEDSPVKTKLIAVPLYAFTVKTRDKETGVSVLHAAMKACSDFIETHDGKLVVKEAPKAVGGGRRYFG